MKINELDSCSFSRDGLSGVIKSPIIWGHKGATISPLCYLRRPTSMNDEDWNEFLNGFSFRLKKKRLIL